MTKNQKLTVAALWIVAVVLAIYAINVTFFNRGYTEVCFLDVGQGDASFIQTDRLSSILIDGGNEGCGDYILKPFLEKKSERCLDAIFVSHMHSDHISGILEIIESDTEIKQIYVSPSAEGEDDYSKLKDTAKDKSIPISVLKGGDKIEIDNVSFTVIGGTKEYENENDKSMILRFDCGENSILYTGDITNEVEKDVLEDPSLDTDILKVAHHGSSTSAGLNFLKKVTAELSVISVGKDNIYHLPSEKTMMRLSAFGAPIARTDYDGTISIIMTDNDIKKVDFSREREI